MPQLKQDEYRSLKEQMIQLEKKKNERKGELCNLHTVMLFCNRKKPRNLFPTGQVSGTPLKIQMAIKASPYCLKLWPISLFNYW